MRKIKTQRQRLSFKQFIRKLFYAFVLTVLLSFVLFIVWAFQSGWVQKKADEVNTAIHQTFGDAGFRLSDEILIHGRERTDLDSIQRALDIPKDRLTMTLDLSQMQERLQALPWVKEALVVRQLPDMLKIDLIERKPIALWQRGNTYYPVDEDGQTVLVLDEENAEELIIVVGKNAPRATPDLIQNLEKYPALMARVMGAKYIDERRWSLYIDDLEKGLVVDLPDSDLAASFARLDRLEKQNNILEKQIRRLDLRFDDKVIIEPVDKDSILLPLSKKDASK